MAAKLVKDLMVPLEEYATVSKDATLYEAIRELEEVHQSSKSDFRHRAVLVFDEKHRVIGKLGQFDILMALESKYSEMGDLDAFVGVQLNPNFVRSLLKQYGFWSRPLEETCLEAGKLRVEKIMHYLGEIEYIDQEASLDEALHQLILGRLQSLITTDGDEIVGILKLNDVFREVSLLIASHEE